MQSIKNAVAGVKERRHRKKAQKAAAAGENPYATTGAGGMNTTTGNYVEGSDGSYSSSDDEALTAGNTGAMGAGNVGAYETRSAGTGALGEGNMAGAGGVAPAVERQAGAMEGGICSTRTYTEVEDRPVIVERVERVLEHHPVEKQYTVETRPVVTREVESTMAPESLGIRERIVDAAEGMMCPGGNAGNAGNAGAMGNNNMGGMGNNTMGEGNMGTEMGMGSNATRMV